MRFFLRFRPLRPAAFFALGLPLSLCAQEPAPDLATRIVAAARRQVGVTVRYDPSYVRLPYPNGDVPPETGVCSDVVVRALREVGVDLQKEVHKDMRSDFAAYPADWGQTRPDPNIDHRRVRNLMCYFQRRHTVVERPSLQPEHFAAGDIVAWDLGRGIRHIGIVSDRRAGRVPLIIHNIGQGAREEDVLYSYRIIGHFRIRPSAPAPAPRAPADPPTERRN